MILFFLVAIACVVLFACLLKTREQSPRDNTPADGIRIAGVSAASIRDFDVFFGRSDYLKLKTRPELKRVCNTLWRDRRRIVLLWFGDLRKDILLLWAFRRFLVRNGLRVTLREEIGVVLTGVLALSYLAFARFIVFVAGPFAMGQLVRSACVPVRRLYARSSELLARLPINTRAGIEQRWADQVSR